MDEWGCTFVNIQAGVIGEVKEPLVLDWRTDLRKIHIPVERLAAFAGKITFWGEIDRQHLLCRGTIADIDAAVRQVHRHLWRKGGCFAQTEFGGAVKPENVRLVFATWEKLTNANAA